MNRESILSAQTLKREPVEIPEWGGTAYVSGMTATQRVAFFEQCDREKKGDSGNTRLGILLLIHTLQDEQGKRILQDDDAAALEQQDGALIDRLCRVANRLNGIGSADAAGK